MRKKLIASCGLVLLCGLSNAAPVDRSTCVRIGKAVSETQLAMAGVGDLEKPRKKLIKLSDQAPKMEQAINALVEVSSKAERTDLGDPTHPMSTGEYDEAENEYNKTYQEVCGENRQ